MTSRGGRLPRLVMGYVLALPFAGAWLTAAVGGEQGYVFILRASTRGGELQLFYDNGFG